MNFNNEQLDMLRHMLGINRPETAIPVPYRDYACVNPGDHLFVELARLGAVERYATRGGYEWFRCTPAGRSAAMASHRTIRYSAAKRRYIKFLDLRDCCPDLTFREFLTDSRYREVRCG